MCNSSGIATSLLASLFPLRDAVILLGGEIFSSAMLGLSFCSKKKQKSHSSIKWLSFICPQSMFIQRENPDPLVPNLFSSTSELVFVFQCNTVPWPLSILPEFSFSPFLVTSTSLTMFLCFFLRGLLNKTQYHVDWMYTYIHCFH